LPFSQDNPSELAGLPEKHSFQGWVSVSQKPVSARHEALNGLNWLKAKKNKILVQIGIISLTKTGFPAYLTRQTL